MSIDLQPQGAQYIEKELWGTPLLVASDEPEIDLTESALRVAAVMHGGMLLQHSDHVMSGSNPDHVARVDQAYRKDVPGMQKKLDTGLAPHELLDLVTAAQRGSREAFDEICMHFQPVVFAIALRRLRNRANASEVTQEVLIQAWNKLGGLREPERFSGWLKQITMRMAINRAVRAPKEAFLNTDGVSVNKYGHRVHQPVDECIATEEHRLMHELIHKLREMDRRTLISFYVNDSSLKEMSVEFHAPIGTIKRRLHTARKRLRELFEKRGLIDEIDEFSNP